MTPPKLLETKSYRVFLKQMLASMKEADPKYSLAYFSRKLNLSDGYLKMVLSGKRELSLDAAMKLSRLFKFKSVENSYFLNLILHDQAKTAAVKNHFSDQLQKVKTQAFAYEEAPQANSIFANSLTWEIYSLFAVADFQEDPHWISARLRRRDASPQKVRIALNKLKQLGVIEKREGRWHTKDAVIKHSIELKEIYKVATERVLAHLSEKTFDAESHFDSFCLVLSDDQYQLTKGVLEEAKMRLAEIARTKNSPKKRIAYFNSNLFWASR